MTREHLIAGFEECDVPEHLRDGLLRYFTQHIRTGDFLWGVLCNDFIEAALRASMISGFGFQGLGQFLVHYAPEEAWGSREKVEAWLAAGRASLE